MKNMALDKKNFVAKRIAKDLKDGDVVNLGIGMPTFVAKHIPEGRHVLLQGENGVLGLGKPPMLFGDWDIYDAGAQPATVVPGAYFFDSATSFALIRGGHVDLTVLGALQVDSEGNLANWMVPEGMVAGYGGAMDLITCAKKVIVAMEHTAKGEPKIFDKCTFPLTGARCVDQIVTEMAVIDVTDDGLVLREIAEGLTVEDVQKATAAKLIIPDDLQIIDVT